MDPARASEAGSVAGVPVQWFKRVGKANARETVLEVPTSQGPPYKAHVWIDASSHESELFAMQVIARLSFGNYADL